MSEMIERVGLAFCKRMCPTTPCLACREASYSPSQKIRGEYDHDGKDHRGVGYEFLARIAIEAMREPTYAMASAPGNAGVTAGDYVMAAFEAENAWRHMIDEALK